jgi:hypothetical protein
MRAVITSIFAIGCGAKNLRAADMRRSNRTLSLQLVLAQHDWQAAANNNKAPPPWKTLTAHTKAK